jgi:hypothetical protein
MNRVLTTGLAVAAVALLTGCGNPDEHTIRDPATGQEVTVQTGSRMQAPRNLPDFAPIYPGGEIQNVVESTSSGEQGAGLGGMVVFQTDADLETVARFYRERLDASGLSERGDVSMGESMILSATAADNPANGVHVTLSPGDSGSGTTVNLTYTRGS